MGKNTKEEARAGEVREILISAETKPDEWYKARITTLEKENLGLVKELEASEDKIDKLNGVIDEYKNDIADLEAKLGV